MLKSVSPVSISIPAAAVALMLATVPSAKAQTDLELPLVSQAAQVKQRVGITDITISYHRPLVGGRKIWGGLVPLGEVWRAGANMNTTLAVSTPVSVEGKPLPAGTYGLHMIPTTDKWTIIFSKMAVAWGSFTYNPAEDALRVEAKPRPIELEDALEYDFEDVKPESVAATMKWEKIAVPFHISVSDAETVLPSIRDQLRSRAQFSWEKLNDAAQYCLAKKIDLEEALRWADQSIENEERFENLSTKAELLNALGRAEEAQKVREHAMEVATPVQLYSGGRQLQAQKRNDEAMMLFEAVAKRAPQNVFGHVAKARIKSAAGDFDGALTEAKAAQAVAPEQLKPVIKTIVDRLQAKQDINK